MCIQFAKGRCTDGDYCRFAHDLGDLRQQEIVTTEHNVQVTGTDNNDIKFKEDCKDNQHIKNVNMDSEKSNKPDINLRKEVHSSEYEEETAKIDKTPIYDPTQYRYNYLNPFYFYSINNFPIHSSVTINNAMPFFNYITINNNSTNKMPTGEYAEDFAHSSHFNSNNVEEQNHRNFDEENYNFEKGKHKNDSTNDKEERK